MPRPLNLLKAFEKGYMVGVDIYGADHGVIPPPGKNWLLMSGIISHVTATTSYLWIFDVVGSGDIWCTKVLAAETTRVVPIFNTVASAEQSAWTPVIITPGKVVRFVGDATAFCRLWVLEWDA